MKNLNPPIKYIANQVQSRTNWTTFVFIGGFFMEQEIWKDIIGFEGIYSISNWGRLKSFKKDKSGRILSNVNKYGWYLTVNLAKYGRRDITTTRIHRLVAEYFIPNPENKKHVNHKDLNKQNNYFENLEWCTCKENVEHAIIHIPSMVYGMNHYNRFVKPVPILQFSLSDALICEYPNAKEASLSTGVCQRNILQVAGQTEYKPGMTRKQAGGFVWKLKIM